MQRQSLHAAASLLLIAAVKRNISKGEWQVPSCLPFVSVLRASKGCTLADRLGVSFCNMQAFWHKMHTDFLPTLGGELAIWPAFQAVNFWRVPVQHQLLAVRKAVSFM